MKRFISIFLSLLMLASSSGVTLATHYCGGEAAKSAILLGHSDLNCDMEKMDEACENDAKVHPQLKSQQCCENHYTSVDADDTITPKQVLNSPDLKFFAAFVFTYLELNSSDTNNINPFLSYSPPLLTQDVCILHQSFLL